MMKFVALALSLFLCSMPSQAKRTPVQRVLDGQKTSVLKTQTATRSVLAHVLPRAQRRLLVTNDLNDDENDDAPGPDELDLQDLFRRPRVVETPHDDDAISDYAMVRLAVARARAMQKYTEVWATKTNT
jgi:hypothetical protein